MCRCRINVLILVTNHRSEQLTLGLNVAPMKSVHSEVIQSQWSMLLLFFVKHAAVGQKCLIRGFV